MVLSGDEVEQLKKFESVEQFREWLCSKEKPVNRPRYDRSDLPKCLQGGKGKK